MSLEKYILPTQKKFHLKTDNDLDSVKASLEDSGLQIVCIDEEPQKSEEPEADKKSTAFNLQKLEITETSNLIEKAFRPKLIGEIRKSDNGTDIALVSRPSKLVTLVIEKISGAVAGAFLALLASSYLLPNPVSITYAFAVTIFIPAIIFIATILISRLTIPKSIDRILNTLNAKFNSEFEKDSGENIFDFAKQPPISDHFIAGIIAAVVFLAVAVGLHNVAEYYWKTGNYQASANLCRPVSSIARAFLDPDSAAVADTNYYLAECMRCLGKTKDAESLYLQVLERYKQDIGEDHRFVGDVYFQLGRIYEETGKLDKAKDMYNKTIDLWSQNKKIGAKNILTSRVRNRVAVIQLKQRQFDEAHKSLSKNIKNDKRYSNKVGSIAKAEDYNDLAVSQYYLKDFGAARKNLGKALKFKAKKFNEDAPQFAATYLNLSYICARTGQREEARQYLNKAARSLNMKIDADKTLDGFKKSFDSNPEFPEEINTAFKKMVKSNNPEYEAPTYDTRANLLLNLTGRN